MGLFTDSVPRDLYDALQTRYDDLLAKYHSLRLAGHEPTKKATLIPPTPDSGQLALKGAEHALRTPGAQAIVEELIGKGMSEADALRQVYDLQNVGRGKTLPPPMVVP